MFEHLSQHARILVTGPQRAGTRIASRMIAQDTGYRWIQEEEYGTHDRRRFGALLWEKDIVIHCPAMCYCIHEHADVDTLVVLMVRDLEDIEASERRVDWKVGPYTELMHYGIPSRQARSFRLHGGRVAAIKYEHWERQRDLIPHWLELEFESLAAHPLWVPQAQRVAFKVGQTCAISAS